MAFNVDSLINKLTGTEDVFDCKSPITVVEAQGFGEFYFDTAGESDVELQSDITDHYVEDGTSMQDHIALKPARVMLSGFIGEYRYSKKTDIFGSLTPALSIIAPLTPSFSAAAIKAIAKVQTTIDRATNIFNRVAGAVGDFGNLINGEEQTRQSKAFVFFESAFNARKTFSVTTPYKKYESMAIETIKANQGEDTRDMTNFTISFKEIRKVGTVALKVSKGATAVQKQPVVNKGVSKGDEVKTNAVSLFGG